MDPGLNLSPGRKRSSHLRLFHFLSFLFNFPILFTTEAIEQNSWTAQSISHDLHVPSKVHVLRSRSWCGDSERRWSCRGGAYGRAIGSWGTTTRKDSRRSCGTGFVVTKMSCWKAWLAVLTFCGFQSHSVTFHSCTCSRHDAFCHVMQPQSIVLSYLPNWS